MQWNVEIGSDRWKRQDQVSSMVSKPESVHLWLQLRHNRNNTCFVASISLDVSIKIDSNIVEINVVINKAALMLFTKHGV
jgi:hypothetical protein